MNIPQVNNIPSNVSFNGNGYFQKLSQRIQNSPAMLRVKNVSPITITIGAIVVALGAFAASFASKAGAKPGFSPLNVVNQQDSNPGTVLSGVPKINLNG